MISLIGFFTRLPIKKTSIEKAAKQSYLLPLVGLFIGGATGVFYVALIYLLGDYINKFVLALLTVLFLYFVTGLNHLDGLADFSDGAYACKSRKEKIKAMKDTQIGISGMVSVLLLLLVLVFSLASSAGSADSKDVFLRILAAELSAKTSMLIAISIGSIKKTGKAGGKGLGSVFIQRVNKKAVPLSVLLSLFASYILLGLSGVCTAIISVMVMLYIVRIAYKNFGFINGDVIGAVNEAARAACLLFLSFK